MLFEASPDMITGSEQSFKFGRRGSENSILNDTKNYPQSQHSDCMKVNHKSNAERILKLCK